MFSKGWDYNAFAEDMKDPDPDKPHQALFDLNQELEKGGFFSDENLQSLVFNAVLGQALDSIYSDVQGAAVKCIPALVKKVNEIIVTGGVQKLTEKLSAGKKEHRDIATISLKYVVEHIPQGYRECISTLSFLLVKLMKTASDDTKLDIMDVAHDLLKRFGSTLTEEHGALQEVFVNTLSSGSTSVRKRSITCLAALSVHTADQLFDEIMNGQVISGIEKQRGETLRKYIQLCSTISRIAGHRVGKYINKIMPLLIDNLDEEKLDQIEEDGERNEVRENILQAFESLVQRCPFQMTQFIEPVIKACKEGMSYDPYYDYDDDETIQQSEEEYEDEDEYMDMLEAEADDDDDVSWKVRKASAKCLSALIQSRQDCLASTYTALCSKASRDIDLQQDAPSNRRCLPERFKEREESVRLDILKVFHDLLTATQVVTSQDSTAITSGSSSFRLSTESKPEVKYLLEISDFIVDCIIKTLKDKSVKVKANCFVLLKLFTQVLGNHSEGSLDKYLSLIRETLSAKETTSVLKTEVLQFLLPLIRTTMHTKSSQKFVTELLPFILQCVEDKYYKIISESLRVCGEIAPVVVKVSDAEKQTQLLFDTVYGRLCTADIHQEVKDCAINTMGCILAHGADVLPKETQTTAFKQLLVLLNSDFCRISVIKTLTVTKNVPMATDVLNTFMTEICSFLRKSSRPLRQASLLALRILTEKGADKGLHQQILKELSPLLTDQDLHLSHLAIELCEAILQTSPASAAFIESEAVLPGILKLLRSPLLQGSALDSMEMLFHKLGPVCVMGYHPLLQAVIESASKAGDNKQVLMSVATVGARLTLSAPTDLQSKTVEKYIANLSDSSEEVRALGLACLGEVGRFIDLSSNKRALDSVREKFSDPKEDIKILAAIALGKIVIGNVAALLPSLLESIKSEDVNRYLNLKALKETLQRSDATNDFDPLKKEYKRILEVCIEFAGSDDEGIRSVVSECIGKLAVLAPRDVTQGMVTRVKEAGHLHSTTSTLITAMKYAVSDSHFTYDTLETDLKLFLSFMSKTEGLTKEDNALNVKVRRAAVQLLTSAVHARPDLVRSELDSYLSALLAQTNVDNELVRSVNLGPFRHKVDDGLELRKSAFECIDILLDGYLQPNWLFESLSDYSPIVNQLVVGMQTTQGQDIQMLNFIMFGKISRLSRAQPSIVSSFETLFADNLLRKVVQDSLNQLKKENVANQDKDKHKDFLTSLLKMIEALRAISGVSENTHFIKFVQEKIDILPDSVRSRVEKKDT